MDGWTSQGAGGGELVQERLASGHAVSQTHYIRGVNAANIGHHLMGISCNTLKCIQNTIFHALQSENLCFHTQQQCFIFWGYSQTSLRGFGGFSSPRSLISRPQHEILYVMADMVVRPAASSAMYSNRPVSRAPNRI